MNELLGNRIKELRCAKNYSQEQMADKIGASKQKYARIEDGLNSMTLDILSKIATALDVTVSDITCVLDEEPVNRCISGSDNNSSEKILEMLDLFYANKHMYARLQQGN
ncbi:helix-turn-helix transcriptional regulator [Butyrivibrio fibrisolvens]|uniref:helix-turn-helix transcriptional regulator n=1 Tax=Butyrivibrio fibrisolvens TaxID=831 RepID=UPI000484F31C|nr:helix-turn-helix transcriptional regulator [Butyrivibrio fibrisolvens]